MLLAYNNHFNQYCKFENATVLDRYNFLAIVPYSGGSCFEECITDAISPWPSHYPENKNIACGCVTAAMLAPWEFIQYVDGDGDWLEASNALQPQEVWDRLDAFMFAEMFPLFSEECDEA